MDSQRPCLALRLCNHEFFQLQVAKSATDRQLALYAIVENYALIILNPHLLVRPVWGMLLVQFSPAAVLADESCHRVSQVGNR